MKKYSTTDITPNLIGKLCLPGWTFPKHLQELDAICREVLDSPTKNRLLCRYPLRHGKSWYVTTVFAAWILITRPNTKIIIATATSALADEAMRWIREIIKTVGEAISGVKLATETLEHIKLARPFYGECKATGVGGQIEGFGFDVLLFDDLHKDQKEVNNPTNRESLQTWFEANLLRRGSPNCKVFGIMSAKHPEDLISWLVSFNEVAPDPLKWHLITKPAINENGEALWPERWPIHKLDVIRIDLENKGNGYLWESMYQGDPSLNPESLEWPASYFTDMFYHDIPDNIQIRARLIILDPSAGSKDNKISTSADYAACLYILYDSTGTLWVEDALMTKKPINEVEDDVVNLYEKYRPDIVAVETNGFQELVAQNLLRKAKDKGLNLPLSCFKTLEVKEVKIRMNLSPLLHQHRIKLKDIPANKTILGQLRSFPGSLHDDGPDSLAMAVATLGEMMKIKRVQPVRYKI